MTHKPHSQDEADRPSSGTADSIEIQSSPDEVRDSDHHDAGDGQGTVSGPPAGEVQDRPVLDGSTMSDEAERSVDNPRRGMEDPGLVRHAETGEKTPTPDEGK